MPKTRYVKKSENAKNKHLVLNMIYKDIGFVLKGVDSTILLGQYPMTAVKRVAKHISTKLNVINGFEINSTTWEGLTREGIPDKLQNILNKNGKKSARLILGNADVMKGRVCPFEDLDFCATWKTDRTTSHDKLDDPLTMIIMRLWAQRIHLSGTRGFTGTVSLRNGRGKQFSFQALDRIIWVLGWKLHSIGGMVDGYKKENATRVSKTGNTRSDGRTFHAYEHSLDIERVASDAAKILKMRLFTYTDDTPMLTFSLRYK